MSVAALGQGNDAMIKPTYVKGEVVSVEDAKIVVKTDSGQWSGVLSDKTIYKRVSPENPTDLKGAADATNDDIGVADKVLLSALMTKEGGYAVRTVYLMTKSDLAAKTQKDNELWRTRGIAGQVTKIDPAGKQISVEVGSGMAKQTLAVTPKADAKFLRYASNSIKFADAKASSISEIHVGDRFRAIGDKSADGLAFNAETVLTSGFRQAAGTIKSIDVDNKQVVVKDLGTSKDITISFADALFVKRFPEEMATRMAGMQMGGGMGMGPGGVRPAGGVAPTGGQVVVMGPPQGGAQPAATGGQPGANGPRMMGGPGGGGNLDAMVERLPNINAADLKVGEQIAVLTSGPIAGVDHVKALKLLAGVEPFIKIAQMQAMAAGARGAAGAPNFNIPGLDGGLGAP